MGPNLRVLRIAIAVRSIEQAKPLYEALFGAEFTAPERGRVEGVRCLVLQRTGSCPAVELVEPRDEDSRLARFLRKRGEGIHHVSLSVENLEETVERLSRLGARLIHTESHYRDAAGRPLREAFLHPKDANGVLFHLVEEE